MFLLLSVVVFMLFRLAISLFAVIILFLISLIFLFNFSFLSLLLILILHPISTLLIFFGFLRLIHFLTSVPILISTTTATSTPITKNLLIELNFPFILLIPICMLFLLFLFNILLFLYFLILIMYSLITISVYLVTLYFTLP